MADVRWRLLEALSLAELASSRPEPLQVNLDHLDKAGVAEYMRRKRHRLTAEYTPGRGWAPTNNCPAEEESQPVVMRQVLTSAEIDSIVAVEVPPLPSRVFPTVHYDVDTALSVAYDVAYSDSHTALSLHRAGFFQHNWTIVAERIVSAMCSAGCVGCLTEDGAPLKVRCVELHTYTLGGSLLNPGHRDSGSTLTISILLSEPSDFEGGEFVTWRGGGRFPVVHDTLCRGDAVLFHSEKLHNVNIVEAGIRNSLVIELWEGGTNIVDRLE